MLRAVKTGLWGALDSALRGGHVSKTSTKPLVLPTGGTSGARITPFHSTTALLAPRVTPFEYRAPYLDPSAPFAARTSMFHQTPAFLNKTLVADITASSRKD